MARYNSYKLGFKIRVINYRNTHNVSQTASKYGIDRKLVRNWVKDKAKILAQNHKDKRVRCVSPREGKYPELEDNIYEWITKEREDGRLVSGDAIQTKARQLNTYGNGFVVSNGWLQRFLKRKRLVRRRVTTSGRALPANAKFEINQFIQDCHKFRDPNFDNRLLLNMDETSIYLDSACM